MPADPKVIREEVAMMGPAYVFSQLCGYAAIEILKSNNKPLSAENFSALGDPTDADKAGAMGAAIAAYQTFKDKIAFRAAREDETWNVGTLGNTQFWADPPNFEGGGGPPPGPVPSVPTTFNGLLAQLKQMALSNPAGALAALKDPVNAELVNALRPVICGSGPAPTPSPVTPVAPV